MQLIPVDPSEISNVSGTHRGRVSYPIIKMFLESEHYLMMLDRSGMQQSLQSINSSLAAYIRSHDLPIKIFTRMGNIYLLRLDLNEDGSEKAVAVEDPPMDIMEELEVRYEEVRGDTTR